MSPVPHHPLTCRYYTLTIGLWWVGIVLVTLVLMQSARTGMDAFVSIWSSRASSEDNSNQEFMAEPGADDAAGQSLGQAFLTILYRQLRENVSSQQSSKRFLTCLSLLAAAATAATVARAFSFAYAGLCAAKRVHVDLLHGCGALPLFQ
jgi:hypothetical protein